MTEFIFWNLVCSDISISCDVLNTIYDFYVVEDFEIRNVWHTVYLEVRALTSVALGICFAKFIEKTFNKLARNVYNISKIQC